LDICQNNQIRKIVEEYFVDSKKNRLKSDDLTPSHSPFGSPSKSALKKKEKGTVDLLSYARRYDSSDSIDLKKIAPSSDKVTRTRSKSKELEDIEFHNKVTRTKSRNETPEIDDFQRKVTKTKSKNDLEIDDFQKKVTKTKSKGDLEIIDDNKRKVTRTKSRSDPPEIDDPQKISKKEI